MSSQPLTCKTWKKGGRKDHGSTIMLDDVHEISRLRFGVFSAKEIIQMAVCEVTSPKIGEPGEINDVRMGTMEDKVSCGSCHKGIKECPGHFGYMRLAIPVVHPLVVFQKMILLFLRSFCFECSKFLITHEAIELMNFPYNHSARTSAIRDHAANTGECPHCKKPQPIFFLKDGLYSMSYSKKSGTKRRSVSVERIRKVFENIDPIEFRLSGGIPEMVQPKDLIITVLPVLPPCARPYVISGGKICDDDLTAKYSDILKQNIKLSGALSEKDRVKVTNNINFHIKTLMDNSKGKAKLSKGRALKCIKERMNGKGRLIRGFLMGKRVDFSSRTVISPAPELRTGEVGVPYEMREIITYPEVVRKDNLDKLENLVNVQNEAVFIIGNSGMRFPTSSVLWERGSKLLHGDEIKRDEQTIDPFAESNFKLEEGDVIVRNGNLTYATIRKKKFFKLHVGDTVERKIKNGDIFGFNRQPTLHAASFLGKKVRLVGGKTFRIPLSTTKTFNADADGDEMNGHFPTTLTAAAECRELLATKHNMISSQGGQCNITLVQDAILGSFLMCKENTVLDRGDFFNMCMAGDNGTSEYPDGFDVDRVLSGIDRYSEILLTLGKKAKSPYESRCLLSLVLPRDFCYEMKNDAIVNEPVLKIYKGIIHEGAMTKKNLSSSTHSITRVIEKEYGSDIAMTFVDNVQFITTAWLLGRGFTVGFRDCLPTKQSEINEVIAKSFLEANRENQITSDPRLKELKINAVLNKARDIGRKIARDSMALDNSLAIMTGSGSKGSDVNIAQISGLLGQQNASGGRPVPEMTHGTRTLPCFDRNDPSYKSRGFVEDSFFDGLSPSSLFFHAMSGREGMTATAVTTRTSGYIQRKLTKCMEDCQVMYDGTVRIANNKVIQFNYGERGLDCSKLVSVKGIFQSCNIARLANRLNMQHERKLAKEQI
jgi:DNA-directed RNA polymerase beta' subunit